MLILLFRGTHGAYVPPPPVRQYPLTGLNQPDSYPLVALTQTYPLG